MTKSTKYPERYTSYQSDKTHSILDDKRRGGIFEYNGIEYDIDNHSLVVRGEMYRYVMPWGGAGDPRDPQPPQPLAEFTDFELFIETFEIEGKTVKWILEHQKAWKYLCPSEHLEKTQWEYFFFTYKGKKYYFSSVFGSFARTDISKTWSDGYYFNTVNTATEKIEVMVGPFENYNEILRKVYIDNKPLKVLFDTEYDDDKVMKASYDDWWWTS